jgi:gluconolactonase
VLATCRHPRAAPAFERPPGFKSPTGHPIDYAVTAIEDVVAAGSRWTTVWTVDGNNADGIVGTSDGGLLIAQNSASKVVRLDQDGGVHVVFSDTNTGGALSMSRSGALFIVQRGLYPSVWQLEPRRRRLADRFHGDPLDCLGSVINDLAADSHGGVYFTDGGLYYADSSGFITEYGSDLVTNGIILGRDEKILYVSSRDSIIAFAVSRGGALLHQREFARAPGVVDGIAIDSTGRLYAALPGGDGIAVFSSAGRALGMIPTPYPVISVAFGGPGKNHLYAVGETAKPPAQAAAILVIPMLAAGYRGRAK